MSTCLAAVQPTQSQDPLKSKLGRRQLLDWANSGLLWSTGTPLQGTWGIAGSVQVYLFTFSPEFFVIDSLILVAILRNGE